MARQWRKFVPTYEAQVYTRTGLSELTDKQLEKEYARVRRDAQERIRSFERSKSKQVEAAIGFAGRVELWEKKDLYMTIKDVKAAGGRELMEDLLLDAMRFVSSKRSSVSGAVSIAKQTVRSLQAAGYDIKMKDLPAFGQFMDYARDRADSRKYGSGTIATTFSKAAKQGIKPEELMKHFKYYVGQVQSGAGRLTTWRK